MSAVVFDRTTRLVTASWDATLRVWDTSTGTLLDTLRGHEAKIHALARSPDTRTWATGPMTGACGCGRGTCEVV